MKKLLSKWATFTIAVTLSFTAIAGNGNIWTKMANFTGAERDYGTGFSIGNYGFIGCGFNGSTHYNDFYKWNQTTNTWSAITNYPGAGYYLSPIGFSVEGKGYVGFGENASSGGATDLWQYDTGKNTWTAMASFPGTGRFDATWFVIGHKLYVIGGSKGGQPYLNDAWVYDTHTNTWKQLNNSPASSIDGMVGFAIGNHGYIGGGSNGSGSFPTASWQYDTTNDSWTSIASYPSAKGIASDARCFVIGSRAFVCTGADGGTYLNPTTISSGYVYDTVSKAWTEFTNMGSNGIERAYSVAFTIGNYGYIGTGIDSTATYQTSFWQYTPDSVVVPVCSIHANFTYTLGANGQVVFTSTSSDTTSATKYAWTASDNVGTGNKSVFNYTYTGNGTYVVSLNITDNAGACTSDTTISVIINNLPSCNIWTKMANFTGAARDYGTGFSIGNYGFIGCGFNGSTHYNDFYKWNQTTNAWSAIASYPGAGYYESPIGFSVEGKGYVGLGNGASGVNKDLWQYDTGKNTWTQMASFPGTGRYDATWFVIGHKLYVVGGSDGGQPYLNDAWVYDTHTNTWKQLNNSPASSIDGMVGFAIGNHGYIGAGSDGSGSFPTAFWQYDTTKDSWTPIASYPSSKGIAADARCFVMGSRAFVCTGADGGTYINPTTVSGGYVYDTISKAWTEFTNMGKNGIERAYSVAFTIGNNGYIGTGIDSTATYQTSFWQYTACADTATPPVCLLHANFTYVLGANGQVTFTSTSKDTTSTTKYAWAAGDSVGTGNKSVFNYTYTSNGTYSVNLSILDNAGVCSSDTIISIVISNLPSCNIWTKMANFTGAARDYGTGFSIGNYGFIGCGFNGSNHYNDFYKWNQTTNAWSAIASYPGAGYYESPISFSVEGKGYVGLGNGASGVNKDLWQYDTGKNTWTQMASFPGTGRYDATWFVIGHKLYVVGGSDGGQPYLNDAWVYDTHTNTWKQLNNSPASSIDGMVGFAIGNHGYIGAGSDGSGSFPTAFWQYDTTKDSWTPIASYPSSKGIAADARCFVMGSRAFVCTGADGGTYINPTTVSGGYVYDTISKAWTEFTNMGKNGIERAYSVAFTIGNNGYIGTGIDSTATYQTSFWQYTACADTATPPVCLLHASFTSTIGANGQVTFTSTSKDTTSTTKYAWTVGDSVGTGSKSVLNYTYTINGIYSVNLSVVDNAGICSSDTTEVITVSNVVSSCSVWTKMANFIGAARDYATGFSIGNYGFIGCGFNGTTHYNDFYKWSQATNIWSTIASYPGAGYYYSPIGFSIEGKGYVGLGSNTSSGGSSTDLWQYDTGKNTWTAMASLPGTGRYDATWFVLGHKLYVIGGSRGGQPYLNDMWVYDTHTNTWKQLKNSPMYGTDGMAGFSIGNHGYIVGGFNGSYDINNAWQYDTTNDSWTAIANWPSANGIAGDARAFVVGSKAYLCTGGDGGSYLNPITVPAGYVYDTISKAWSEFANMGSKGLERSYSVAFTIGNNGYIGTGIDSTSAYLNSFWQYTPCDTILPPACTLAASFTSNSGTGGKVTFTSTSTGISSGTKYTWDAGDGKGHGSGSTFAYTYLNNGTYLVNLTAADSNGTCASTTSINVAVTNAAPCSLHSSFIFVNGSNGQVTFASTSKGTSSATQYYWNAGNNSGGGNGSSFIYTYPYNGTYGVNLFISDSSSSCSSDTTIYVTVANAAVCSLKADFTYSLGTNGAVTFTNASAGMTGLTQIYWYTGDSVGYGYGNPYNYTYQKNGTYPVTLSLANTSAGCSADTTIMVTISNANNSASTCSLGIIVKSARASCDTCSDGSANATVVGGTGPYSYHWNNGSTATSIVTSPGIYTCCVTDANGCSACASTTVTDSCLYAEFTYTVKYNSIGDSATISFVSISDTVCADSVLFHGSAKPQKSVSYTWNFGDGNSQTISGIGVKTSSHSFSTNSIYNITLAINRQGSQVRSVAIKPVKLTNPSTPTGITSLSTGADIKLYPNPNTGSFKLVIGNMLANQDGEIEVTDMLGELICKTSVHSMGGELQKDMNLSNVMSGTYFVRVITQDKVYVSKLVIAK